MTTFPLDKHVDDQARVLQLLRAHGWNATSFQILEQGFRYWLDPRGEGCVAYVDTGRAWVVAGAPIAAETALAAVADRFVAAAKRAGRRASFFAAEERFTLATGMPAMHVGEQPEWDPARWDDAVRASRSLREQLRRARAKGVVARAATAAEVSDLDGPLRRAMQALVARWLSSRKMAPMGFLVAVQPFFLAEERRYVVAERDGQLVGFLAAVPVYARHGWFFEDLLRDPRAPNGTAELLVDAAMRLVAAEGSRYVTLGLAPLAGAVSGWLRVVKAYSAALYDFDGVRAFKAKLRPQEWRPIYLAYPRGSSGELALYDVLAAFAEGSFTRFGVETLLRGPALAVRVLAALLVPWTALLAIAPARRWFPAPWVKWGWVAFDALLVVALFALARRWRRPLGLALACAITADAIVTAGEAFAFNVERVRALVDVAVIVVSCAGPTLAALLLWAALGARATHDAHDAHHA